MTDLKITHTIKKQLKAYLKRFKLGKVLIKTMLKGKEYSRFPYFANMLKEDMFDLKLADAIEAGCDIFFSLNSCRNNSYKQEDIISGSIKIMGFDFDGLPKFEEKEALIQALIKAGYEPQAYVFTKNGVHIYYFLFEFYTVEDYKYNHKVMQGKFKEIGLNPDSAVSSPTNLMRLPNTYHHKQEPYLIGDMVFTDSAFLIEKVRFVEAKKATSKQSSGMFAKEGSYGYDYAKDFSGCKSVYDVYSLLEKHPKIHSLSDRQIAELLTLNGYKITKSTVARHRKVLVDKGLVSLVCVHVFDLRNPSNNRSAKYSIRHAYHREDHRDKYRKPAMELPSIYADYVIKPLFIYSPSCKSFSAMAKNKASP